MRQDPMASNRMCPECGDWREWDGINCPACGYKKYEEVRSEFPSEEESQKAFGRFLNRWYRRNTGDPSEKAVWDACYKWLGERK